jgi:hypothetical protein
MSISVTDPRRIEPGEAPFMPGDRVVYRPLPAGIETVELVEYRREGWGGWYLSTRRQVVAHHYDRAELFDGPSSRWMPHVEGCPQAWPGSE